MFTENFIVLEPNPKDVKSALDMLNTMVRAQNDTELLLKMGEIQGAYTIYERTKDTTILEHIIIDIIKLFNNMLSPKRTTVKPSLSDIFGEKRTDLIYYQFENNVDKIPLEILIEKYLDGEQKKKSKFSDNTRSGYASSLRKVFKDMGITAVTSNQLRELKNMIEEHMKNHTEYNHNIKSAVNGFIKYLLDIGGILYE